MKGTPSAPGEVASPDAPWLAAWAARGPVKDLLSLAAGALLTGAFAPFGLFPLAVLSPAVNLIQRMSPTPLAPR